MKKGPEHSFKVFVHDGGASVSLRLFDLDPTFTTDRTIVLSLAESFNKMAAEPLTCLYRSCRRSLRADHRPRTRR